MKVGDCLHLVNRRHREHNQWRPARIFGLDGQLGSVEAGKLANLFVTDGDPFEPATEVRDLFIAGFRVPLVSRHTELNEEFLNRQPGLAP